MKLNAFEFITPANTPQLVYLCHASDGRVLAQFGSTGWIGIDLRLFELPFERKSDLLLQGNGLGRPYWDDEPLPSWLTAFDSRVESSRINAIRTAAEREVNRAKIVVSAS